MTSTSELPTHVQRELRILAAFFGDPEADVLAFLIKRKAQSLRQKAREHWNAVAREVDAEGS